MDEFIHLTNDPPMVLDPDSEPWNSSFDSLYPDQVYPESTFPTDFLAQTPAPGTPGLSIGSPLKPLVSEAQHLSDRKDSALQGRQLVASSSPESSSQESSSESSGRGRKRKSSSLSNPYDMLNSMESPDMSHGMDKQMLDVPHDIGHRKDSPLLNRTDQDVENIGQRFEHDFAFSNHNSPGTGANERTIAPSQLEFVANHTMHSPPVRRTDWIIGGSRDNSPNMTVSNEASPAGTFNPTPPPFHGLPTFSTPSNNPTWQQSTFPLGISPSPGHNAAYSPFSTSRRESSPEFKTWFKAIPSQWKSRVETQINMTFYVYPLSPDVQRLHLPTVSISKPKFLAKEIAKAPDTLELHTSLVCASAMRNPDTRRMALLRAQGVSIKAENSVSPAEDGDDGSSNDNDPEKPLNGGEVRICENCMAREHKRATRKRTKQQEGEETWFQYAKDRIIIFNEKEYQEWKPVDPTKDVLPGDQLPEGTMKITVPTRIACYCRHQQEKIGFQIIFTLKDHKGNVVTQTMTDAITITDDHKTNGNAQFPQDSLQAPSSAANLQRPYHSANDLPALQNSQVQFHHHQPPQPFGQRQESFSQGTSTTMTPHSYQSLSRQASPSAQAGPNKRRKNSSSHHRLPSNLTMTRLDTAQPPAMAMSGVSSAGSLVNSSAFTPTTSSFIHPNDMLNAIAMPSSATSPQTPNIAAPPVTPGVAMRNQSGENLTSFYSLPNSAQPSRSGSPVGFRNSHTMSTFQQQQLNAANAFGSQFSNSQSAMDAQQQVRQHPAVYKVLPNEGPLSGGKEVTCLGTGFTRTTEVFFGGIAAVPVTYWGPSTLVCLTPPGSQPGQVPVTVRDTNNGALSPQQPHAIPKATFTYTDDGEKQLLELVLRVIGDKHQGTTAEGFKSFLMNIVETSNRSNGGWGSTAGGSHNGYRHSQRNVLGAENSRSMDTEEILMKCLDVIDLDESPYPPQYNMCTRNGSTMLSLACSLGYTRFVAALLARGADTETRDHNGFTPLMLAALHGHAHLVRRLLLKGADPSQRSLKGYLAYDLASTEEVAEALSRLPRRNRTRSGGDERMRSRANSLASLHSIWDTPSPSQASRRSSRVEMSEDVVDSSDDTEAAQSPITSQAWLRSRRNSAVLDHTLSSSADEDHARFLSPAAAMAAWGNHLATQIQHFQQNVNWNFPNFQLPALPPMPNLPDYQAHPMVRRISSLVPHRTPSRNANSPEDASPNGNDSSWRDMFSSSPLPPPYEEIYPDGSNDVSGERDLKKRPALEAAAETLLDQKCTLLFDSQTEQAESSSKGATRTIARAQTEDSDTDLDVRIGKKMLTREEQEKMKRAHARKLKKIRSDRNLWMIWIPLLLIVLGMMLKNRLFDLVAIGARYMQGSQQQGVATQPRIVEIA